MLCFPSSGFCGAENSLTGDLPIILPEPFVSILHASHPGEFYDRQAAQWEAIATGDCATDEAWWHYYKTAHYSNRFGKGTYDLSAILAAAETRLDPAGFELNYLRFAHEKDPVARYPHLLKAHAVGPDRSEAFTGLAAYYSINGQAGKRNEILARLHKAQPLPAGVMEYNHNQLQSVAADGILLTNGDTDTYPSWLLQSAYQIRPDVEVICLPLLLGFDGYREEVRKRLGLEELSGGYPLAAEALLNQLLAQNRPVYLAATGTYFDDLPSGNLYVTGLAFRYSKEPVDNLGQLASHYREDWRLEHLREPLDNSPTQAVADQLNQNYLPGLMQLHAYYLENTSPDFQGNLRLIEKIAGRVGRGNEVMAFLRGETEPEPLASKEPGVRAKDVLKEIAYIPAGELKRVGGGASVSVAGFFIGEEEVSNADYQLFLEDLLRQRKFELLDSVAVAEAKLAELLPAEVFERMERMDYDLANPLLPVVNVSHAAAELYARWLTEVHNNDQKRKDKRRVRFRLPTETEFEWAFRGGKDYAPYPWGGPYYRNTKGCYLNNFNTFLEEPAVDDNYYNIRGVLASKEEQERSAKERQARWAEHANECTDQYVRAADGAVITTATDAYFPNDYGLYNMAGNAAEMTTKNGVIMGGSWLDRAQHMQAGVVVERTLPHPSTGFRLVMEYLD